MPLPSGQYTLACWNSTKNPENVTRSNILFQCHKLIKALRAKLSGDQIVVPSRDSEDSIKGIEICIMFNSDSRSSFFGVKDTLNEEASKLSLDYTQFIEQDESLTRFFNDEEMANLEELARPITEDLTEKDFEDLEKTAREFTGFDVTDSWSKAVSKEKITAPMLMTRRTLAKLRKAEKDDLRKEITGYMDSLNAMSKAPKTAWQTIVLIAGGIIAVGGYIAKLGGIWAAIGVGIEMIALVSGFIGVVATAAIIGVIVVVLGAIVGEW